MADNKRNKRIDSDRFNELLAIAGYIPPRTDTELELFESFYADYSFELKDVQINPRNIIDGSFEKKGKIVKIQDKNEQQDIDEIRLAARKGSEEIPKSIFDKMKNKHQDGDNKQT